MPTYDYACPKCGVIVAESKPMKDRDRSPICREGCGTVTRRLPGVSAVFIK